jgi:hypothetical protein
MFFLHSAHTRYPNSQQITMPSPHHPKYRDSVKRTSRFPFLRNRHQPRNFMAGSMTVEAAILMPLMLCFFLNLGSAIEMMRFHGHMQMALWETGNHLALYGNAYDIAESELLHQDPSQNGIVEQLTGVAFTQTYVKAQVMEYLKDSYGNASNPGSFILREGTQSLNFWESSLWRDDDCIDLIVSYPVQTMFSVAGIGSFRMSNRYFAKAWTGYDRSKHEDAHAVTMEYVYVTEHGTVWHETRDCTYINLSIRSATLDEAKATRNHNGSPYKECSLCKNSPVQSQVYITDSGTSYHYRANCSGLKRVVFAISKSEASGYRPCPRCAVAGGGS